MADAPPRRRIRVAVVDDSVFVRGALKRMFENDPRIHVVGCASSGEELLQKIGNWEPDVVTLDLNMPGIGGLATLDQMHADRPRLPVIVLSSALGDGAATSIEALCREHVDFIDKQALSLADFSGMRRLLITRIEALTSCERPTPVPTPPRLPMPNAGAISIIVIGASTGGPPAIETILRALGPNIPLPIVIAQHMPPGFTNAFAQRLDSVLPLQVREALDGDVLFPGLVLIAPGGHDLRISRQGANTIVVLKPASTNTTTPHPSVDHLFTTTAHIYGAAAAGVLLTGMGTDGARGLSDLHRRGAHTIAQDESTSIVFGMPQAAIALGAASEVTALAEIGGRLNELVWDVST
jgi:two-component system chemotaxis response regulator CheB